MVVDRPAKVLKSCGISHYDKTPYGRNQMLGPNLIPSLLIAIDHTVSHDSCITSQDMTGKRLPRLIDAAFRGYTLYTGEKNLEGVAEFLAC